MNRIQQYKNVNTVKSTNSTHLDNNNNRNLSVDLRAGCSTSSVRSARRRVMLAEGAPHGLLTYHLMIILHVNKQNRAI